MDLKDHRMQGCELASAGSGEDSVWSSVHNFFIIGGAVLSP
jgi:hypothetical protein